MNARLIITDGWRYFTHQLAPLPELWIVVAGLVFMAWVVWLKIRNRKG